jgi:hypothetical protein
MAEGQSLPWCCLAAWGRHSQDYQRVILSGSVMRAFDAGSAWLPEFRLATPGETGRAHPVARTGGASNKASAPELDPWGLSDAHEVNSARRSWQWARPEFAVDRPRYRLSDRLRAFLATFDHRAALWGSFGFMAGMVVWHFVGFWWFVAGVVLNSGPETVREATRETAHIAAAPATQTETQQTPPASTAPLTTGSIGTFNAAGNTAGNTAGNAAGRLCVALVIDRTSGQTVSAPCAAETSPLRDAGRRRRGDRAPAATAVLPLLQGPDANAASTALAETDFNLEITAQP